jgi:hypothetical protein
MVETLRKLVSGNRRRFTEDNVNLDLTYITPQIIAMSYPSSGLEKFYRNNIVSVSCLEAVMIALGFVILE